jgi:hypothetical protein
VQINQSALDRILNSEITGERIVELFEMMRNAPSLPGATLALALSWQQPGDIINPGEMVPSLTFTLRAPVNMDPSNAALPGPTVDPSSGPASE